MSFILLSLRLACEWILCFWGSNGRDVKVSKAVQSGFAMGAFFKKLKKSGNCLGV